MQKRGKAQKKISLPITKPIFTFTAPQNSEGIKKQKKPTYARHMPLGMAHIVGEFRAYAKEGAFLNRRFCIARNAKRMRATCL